MKYVKLFKKMCNTTLFKTNVSNHVSRFFSSSISSSSSSKKHVINQMNKLKGKTKRWMLSKKITTSKLSQIFFTS